MLHQLPRILWGSDPPLQLGVFNEIQYFLKLRSWLEAHFFQVLAIEQPRRVYPLRRCLSEKISDEVVARKVAVA